MARGQNIRPLQKLFSETQYHTHEQIEKEQFSALKRMLEYAYTSIPFYRNKYRAAGICPSDIMTVNDVDQIPLLTKQEIMDCGDMENTAFRGKKYKRSTSGSTGNPLVFYKDNESMTCLDAIMYRNYSWFGVDLGDRQARFWGHPLSKTGILKTRTLDAFLNRIRLSAFNLDDANYMQYLSQIKRFKAQYVYGYAQAVFQFSNYFHTLNIDLSFLNIKAVILTGEMVFPHQMQIMKAVFGCPVTQEYGCTELGLIGFGCPEGTIHLMENLFVETLSTKSHNDNGEIVISELYGKLFPFIRYQIGDKGRLSHRNCSCGRGLKVLEQLFGRKDDFIKLSSGRLVDAYVVEYIINDMPVIFGKISQFKLVQSAYDVFKIFLVSVGDRNKIGEYLTVNMKKTLHSGISVKIVYVESLPKELSGKLKCFVSELID